MKVFDRPFFKKVAGTWGGAPSRARRRETFSAFLLCQAFFFAPVESKKKAGDAQRHVTLRKLSPFFLAPRAQRRTYSLREIKRRWLFRSLRRATRALPLTCEPLKRLDPNFS
jgi:hypothetical protein